MSTRPGSCCSSCSTGQQPHTGESALAVAYKHVNETVPPPSGVQPGLPHALDALVALATSRDPGLRPADAGQFLGAVRGVRRGQPIPWPPDRPAARRHATVRPPARPIRPAPTGSQAARDGRPGAARCRWGQRIRRDRRAVGGRRASPAAGPLPSRTAMPPGRPCRPAQAGPGPGAPDADRAPGRRRPRRRRASPGCSAGCSAAGSPISCSRSSWCGLVGFVAWWQLAGRYRPCRRSPGSPWPRPVRTARPGLHRQDRHAAAGQPAGQGRGDRQPSPPRVARVRQGSTHAS